MNTSRLSSSTWMFALAWGTAGCGNAPYGSHDVAATSIATHDVGTASIALRSASCSGSDAGEPGRCGAIPADVEGRFEAMRGPLGCAPTSTPVPDPPGGCSGAEQLLCELRLEYTRLWEAGHCGTTPPSLVPFVSEYDRAFALRHHVVAHTIRRQRWLISAREFGAEHAAEGPTIVLMHGFPDNQHLYDLVAPALGETHRTITFDFVGWGDSSKPGSDYDYTFDALRSDLEAVLAYFGVREVVPVVHDASGWPGIDWALDNPQSVTALVLLNTTYQPLAGQAPPNVTRALSALDLRQQFTEAVGTDELMSRALVHAQVSHYFEDEERREEFLPLFDNYALSSQTARFALTGTIIQAVRSRVANIPRMKSFPKPVTIAFGADDPYLNPQVARGFASVFPDARLELIDHARHYVQLDRPERVTEAIRAAARGQ